MKKRWPPFVPVGGEAALGSEIENGYDDAVHGLWKADDSDEGP
jgi:hypothetical protein